MVRWEGGPSEVSLPGPSMTTHHRGSVHVPRARVPRRATHHLLPPSRKRNLSSPHYLGTYVPGTTVFFCFFYFLARFVASTQGVPRTLGRSPSGDQW